MYSNDDNGRVYRICKLNNRWDRGSCATLNKIVKMLIFPFLISSRAWNRQIKYMIMMTKEESTKICKWNDPRGRGCRATVLTCINIQHIACYCIKMIWFSFSMMLLILLFYDGPYDMQIWCLRTRSQCRVFDTQVTFKAHGLLLKWNLVYPVCKQLVF